MPDYITTPISEEERNAIFDKYAKKVADLRLETPVILFLESHKPLSFLAGQALVVGTPLLGPLFGLANMNKLSQILSDRENVERFIQKIEELVSLREQEKEK